MVLLFNKISLNKIFIGYDTYYYGVLPLYIRLPIRNTIAKYSENSKNMNLLVHDDYISKNIKILNNIESILNKIKDLSKNSSIVN